MGSVFLYEAEDCVDVAFGFMVGEEDGGGGVPGTDCFFSLFVNRTIFTPQIPFRVYDKPFSSSKRLFEKGIARAKRDAIVAAFDYEIDGGEHGLHF